MADIRKRDRAGQTTYQVRYPCRTAKSGYRYKTFHTMKAARAFLESGKTQTASVSAHPEIDTVPKATEWWLRICEKEGLNGREPITYCTYKNYSYRAEYILSYDWPRNLQTLTPPDIVAFRSWLLRSPISRDTAGKVMAALYSVLKEMTIRGVIPYNVATGISIRQDSRYKQPPSIPSKREIMALLQAADALANDRNAQIARTWERYRPILYLAVDFGMRPLRQTLSAARTCMITPLTFRP